MGYASEIRLAWRLLVRDWRAGEVTLIAAAIVIAVAAVTTVGFFTDRVQRALQQEANRLLGADLALGDSRPIGPNSNVESRKANSRVEIVISGEAVGELPLWEQTSPIRLGTPSPGNRD